MISQSPHNVVIVPSALRVITREALASADGNETGGILLGTAAGDTLTIRHAAGPGPNATRRPDFFQRDLDHAQHLGDEVFATDRSVWVGDWHTHLGVPPTPSTTDLATYQRLFADPELAFDQFVAVILSASNGDWAHPSMAVWLVTRDRISGVALEVTP